MAKEDSGNAREIIKKWMPVAIWLAAVMIAPYWLWIDEKKSLQFTLLNVSALIPLFLLLSTLFIETGGFVMSGIMMAERLWRERKERIHKEKIAAALSPLALRVATGFIMEHDTELVDKSDSDLLEMIKAFGANKALDIAAEETRADILEFVNSIDHERRANQIAVKISDLMGRDDFANQVVDLVKENQYLHIA
ncbi:MAG: hypothetical protein OXN25_05465 [Candidatus Poribacteria bacterium]|nr:hypothetical protein [Candidatus Poribacteria bacterium]MYK18417.1 hypothetical protein [Candidatus Poribacteria bacterium]